MINQISTALPVLPVTPLAGSQATTNQSDFGAILRQAIGQVEGSGSAAAQAVEGFLGGQGELHEVALKTQKSSLEFEMLLQVRNKVVQAYQEIMRMQV